MILRIAVIVSFLVFPVSVRADLPPASVERKYERRAVFIAEYDQNEDMVLQKEEITAMIEGKFKAADKDEDGIISAAELEGIVQRFSADYGEIYGTVLFKQLLKLRHRLGNADRNDDGQLTWSEYSTYFNKRYKRFDSNNDSQITVQEFETDVEKD